MTHEFTTPASRRQARTTAHVCENIATCCAVEAGELMSSSSHPLENLTGGRVKAGMLKAHLEWVQNHHGDAGLEKVLSALAPESRLTVERSLMTSWIPFKDLIDVDRKVVELWGEKALEDLGFYSANVNLTRTYRAYVKNDIHEFFRRSIVLHPLFQDFGTIHYEATGRNSGTMTHSNYTCVSRLYCRTAVGYFKGVLHTHGATQASVVERACVTNGAENCTFDMRWS